MFEEFYEMYEPEEQEVVALINRCIGGGYNWKGSFWEMTVVTLGMVFCDTGEVTTNDDVLYVLRNGTGRNIYYLVHLTYSAHNVDGFPQYEEFADLFAVKEFIERSYIENYM